jgi:D-beta-D-heptose 7-phosphate kinase / D-beta-D-heptose 1-phosphate adenosyltransferase
VSGGQSLLVIGDSLLDRDLQGTVDRICPDAPAPVFAQSAETRRPGGAALAACLASSSGIPTTLVTALGGEAGGLARTLLEKAGVHVVDLGLSGATPEKIRVRCGEQTLLRVDRGAGRDAGIGGLGLDARSALADAAAVLVSDYGHGMTAHASVRRALGEAAMRMPVVWDPHPRGGDPVAGVALATPNRAEARAFAGAVDGDDVRADAERASELRRRWHAAAVAITLGASGALLDTGSRAPAILPVPAQGSGDPCGAGDRFSSSAAVALLHGQTPEQAVESAVADAALYVMHGASAAGSFAPPPPADAGGMADALAVAERVRAGGGVVVATGGCFDLLHAGHLATLEAARRLGDCLVVLLNSDRSVTALKGPQRPVVGQRDRARLLAGLGCVDAVAIFDDLTPVPALEALRPHVFAKGGDYRDTEIPEAEIMRRLDGQTVILPTVAGHSTSAMIERAATREAVA